MYLDHEVTLVRCIKVTGGQEEEDNNRIINNI